MDLVEGEASKDGVKEDYVISSSRQLSDRMFQVRHWLFLQEVVEYFEETNIVIAVLLVEREV